LKARQYFSTKRGQQVPQRKYDDCFISPEIKDNDGWQSLHISGKDARGYDFAIDLAAIEAGAPGRNLPETVEADRVSLYIGATPDTVDDIGTEIEIKLGNPPERYRIDTTAMVYISGGVPYHETVTRVPDKRSWVLHLTLPPRYEEPENPENSGN